MTDALTTSNNVGNIGVLLQVILPCEQLVIACICYCKRCWLGSCVAIRLRGACLHVTLLVSPVT